jgi:hypothetical protein
MRISKLATAAAVLALGAELVDVGHDGGRTGYVFAVGVEEVLARLRRRLRVSLLSHSPN